jgi:hypothetical protein
MNMYINIYIHIITIGHELKITIYLNEENEP